MLRHPRLGQRVRVHYRTTRPRGALLAPAEVMPYHGWVGTIAVVGKPRCGLVDGRRKWSPRNHGVLIGGQLIVVPAGNLFREGGA